jgi:hypothetical protein
MGSCLCECWHYLQMPEIWISVSEPAFVSGVGFGPPWRKRVDYFDSQKEVRRHLKELWPKVSAGALSRTVSPRNPGVMQTTKAEQTSLSGKPTKAQVSPAPTGAVHAYRVGSVLLTGRRVDQSRLGAQDETPSSKNPRCRLAAAAEAAAALPPSHLPHGDVRCRASSLDLHRLLDVFLNPVFAPAAASRMTPTTRVPTSRGRRLSCCRRTTSTSTPCAQHPFSPARLSLRPHTSHCYQLDTRLVSAQIPAALLMQILTKKMAAALLKARTRHRSSNPVSQAAQCARLRR